MPSAIEHFEQALSTRLGAPVPGATQPREVEAVWAPPGFEVALVRRDIDRRSLKRLWRARQANRARPLLLVAPSEAPDRVAVVGPAETEPRDAEPIALFEAVAPLATATPRQAQRALEQALERLSEQSLPGVLVRGLLTDHYVRTRLPEHQAATRAELAEAAAPAAGRREWREALEALGYAVRQRPRD